MSTHDKPQTLRQLKGRLRRRDASYKRYTLGDCAAELGISPAAVSQAVHGRRTDDRVEAWLAQKTGLDLCDVRHVTRTVGTITMASTMLARATGYSVMMMLNPLRALVGMPIVQLNGYPIYPQPEPERVAEAFERFCETLSGDVVVYLVCHNKDGALRWKERMQSDQFEISTRHKVESGDVISISYDDPDDPDLS